MLNIDYFNIIRHIYRLFKKNDYYCKQSIQYKTDAIYYEFIKNDNIEYRYSIIIYNDNYIKVTIPIKNSNFKYSTYIDNILTVYNYLYIHTKDNKK